MKAKIIKENLTLFKKLIDQLSKMITECDFVFSPNGVFLRAMNKSNSSFVSLNINKDFFTEYSTEEKEIVSLDLLYFKKILSRIKDDVALESGDCLKLISNKKEFIIPLFAEPVTPDKPVNVNFVVFDKIDLSAFSEMVNDATTLNEEAVIKIVAQEHFLKAETRNEGKEFKYTFEEKTNQPNLVSGYRVDLLEKTLFSGANELTLSFLNEGPILVKYEIPNIELSYIVAANVNYD